MSALLALADLTVQLPAAGGWHAAVDAVTLQVPPGGTLGVVGESGSGKSMTFLATLGLAPAAARLSGSVQFRGRELLGLSETELDRVRGREIGIVLQDAAALTPHLRIGDQLAEAAVVHHGWSRALAAQCALELLAELQFAEPERRMQQYPHELSGGMRQRVMLAMALTAGPALLIADEPTTALDVTLQAQLLGLLQSLRRARDVAIVLISHDLGVVAQSCDQIAVMYAGRIVEQGPTAALLSAPQHPYTRGLLGSIPRRDSPLGAALAAIPGQPPVRGDWTACCAFRPRCQYAFERCASEQPALRPGSAPQRLRRCHLEPEAL